MKKLKITILITFLLGASALLISYLDKTFHFQNLSLILHLTSVFLGISISVSCLFPKIIQKPKQKLNTLFIIILILSISTRFLFLKNYPYVSQGDEVRDGGLNASQIYHRQIENIFAYGRYDAHGLIIPTFVSIFYPIFGDTNLTYRTSAAIIGILDILLIFIFISKIFNSKIGFWSSLFLISLPLHLFYSRTQIVVIFSSFLTTCLLVGTYFYLQKKEIWSLLFLGLLIGFSFNFHASMKPVSLTILLTVFLNEIINLKKNYKNLIIFILSIIIAFGPRIWFTPFNIFFHTSRLPSGELGVDLINKYFSSLLVWFANPTTSFFNNNLPLTNPLLFSLLFIGILILFKNKKTNLWIIFILFLSVFIPFTNSAITDGINFDHRLAPLFPIAAILFGFGVDQIFGAIKKPILNTITKLLIIFLLSNQAYLFFTQRMADVNWGVYKERDYLTSHLINLINKKSSSFSSELCIEVPSQNYSYYELAHIQEQFQFFLPKYSIKFISNETQPLNSIIIKNNCQNNFLPKKYIHNCTSKFDFSCPKNYSDSLLIYY